MNLTQYKIEETDKLVTELYNKYRPTAIDIDDMKQECYLAILTCNLNRSVKTIVETTCKDLLMKYGYSFPVNCLKNEFYNLSVEQIEDEYGAKRFYDLEDEEVECNLYKGIDDELLSGCLDTLTYRERDILELRYKEQLTYDQIGAIYKLSGPRIRQIENKALRKLRHPSRSNILKYMGEVPADRLPLSYTGGSSSSHTFSKYNGPVFYNPYLYLRYKIDWAGGDVNNIYPLIYEIYNHIQNEDEIDRLLYKVSEIDYYFTTKIIGTFILNRIYDKGSIGMLPHNSSVFELLDFNGNNSIDMKGEFPKKVVFKINGTKSTRVGYLLNKVGIDLEIIPVIFKNSSGEILMELGDKSIRKVSLPGAFEPGYDKEGMLIYALFYKNLYHTTQFKILEALEF